jgi:serine phosphatase RsbU (regulator of sigma subunit)/pSer/pThr/pTyr-binding forkhead associated (FHA) protein
MPEISIQTPDGRTRTYRLEGDRVGLGRANSNELCYQEDTGLSRKHLVFEREEDDWILRDPGSKNGTLLNGQRLKDRQKLKPGDRIVAGHLAIVFDAPIRPFQETVMFVDRREEPQIRGATVSTNLARAISMERGKTARLGQDRSAALIKAGRELAGHRPLEELFPVILNLAIEAVHAERGVLLTAEGDSLVVRAARGHNFRISTGVRDRVLKGRASILVNDVMSDEAFRGMESLVQQQVHMLMAVPLQGNQNVIGLIYVDSPAAARKFTVDDLNLLTVMSNVAAIRIEHARLVEIEQAEKLLANELEQAAIIQRGLLPSEAPVLPGLQLAGYNAACRTVGGDYYDFIPYEDGRVAIALGDVSGKAMPAALLMTSLHARVRVLAEEPPDVAQLMTRLNRITASSCPSNRFISFFFSVLDARTGELSYSNAGHNPPIMVRRDNSIEYLDGGGLIMGIFGNSRYEAYRARLEPGDLLLLYSDGVTEAVNAAGEEFQEHRLIDVLRANRQRSSQEIITAVRDEVSAFTAGTAAADDLTLVAARRIP